jgi:hypothetical protein
MTHAYAAAQQFEYQLWEVETSLESFNFFGNLIINVILIDNY